MAGNRSISVTNGNSRGKKRPRDALSGQNTPRKNQEGQKDPYRSDAVLPVFEDSSAPSNLENDEDMSAMMYLRSVRDEAAKIPALLTAPRRSSDGGTLEKLGGDIREKVGRDDSHGGPAVYQDGIYMAIPLIGPMPPSRGHPESTASEFYEESYADTDSADGVTAEAIATDCLLQRFDQAREFFGDRSMTYETGASTRNSNKTSDFQIDAQMPYNLFYKMVQETNPIPIQLIKCSLESIYHMLDLTTAMIKLNKDTESNLAVWIWALLSRLPDVGEMTNDDVSIIRNLGKRALKAGEAFVKRSLNEEQQTSHSEESDEIDDKNRARRNTSSPPPGPPHSSEAKLDNFFLTIDTIILIVGARFGQKDIQMTWSQVKTFIS